MFRIQIALVSLLGALAMTTPHLACAGGPTPEAPVEPRLLTDLTDATPDLGWVVVNDGVMGGRSRGDFEVADGRLRFAGSTDTDGGGFSSIRSGALELDLSRYEGIRVRVRGDGRRYTWRLTTDARWRGRPVGWWADFTTRAGEWIDVDVPFSAFRAQWRGRMLDGYELDPARIRGMGLMIYDGEDGPFELRLDSVHAFAAPRPFTLASERWRSRILVASAPSAEHEHMKALLEDAAATRAEMEDRDVLLVVLVDGGGSRAGDRPLDDDEVSAAREHVGIDAGSDTFALRLVGKDGGVKLSRSAPTPLQDVYDLIDTMPMRRDEMRR